MKKKEQKCVFIENEGKRERERERERRVGIEQKRDKNNYLFWAAQTWFGFQKKAESISKENCELREKRSISNYPAYLG